MLKYQLILADAVEKVKLEYSPIGKEFTDGLSKEDKSKKLDCLND